MEDFTKPAVGEPNTLGYIDGMYSTTDITPYIHVFVYHMPQFMFRHRAFGLKAFSCSALEKKNHLQVKQFFNKTPKDGFGNAVKSIVQIENHSLFFQKNNTPVMHKEMMVMANLQRK